MGMNDDDARVHDALRKLENDLKSIKPSKVLLVGDIMMDCYIHGFANNLRHIYNIKECMSHTFHHH